MERNVDMVYNADQDENDGEHAEAFVTPVGVAYERDQDSNSPFDDDEMDDDEPHTSETEYEEPNEVRKHVKQGPVRLNLPEPIVVRASAVSLPSKTRLKVTVNKLHITAEWKWTEGGDDSCGICRMPFEACCVDCMIPGDGCPLVLGVCKHPFHQHCIQKWLESQQAQKPQCPLCRQEWKFASR